MLAWIRSRKFKLTMGAVLAAVAGGLTGQMTWSQVIWAVVVAFGANGLGIAIEDHGAKMAGK
jgi:hypothetical protein